MKVLKPRAALLSDYEVLKVLKDMEAEQKQRSQDAKDRKTSISSSSHTALAEPAQASAPAPGGEDDEWMQQVPENLRTIQYETIAFLSQVTRPCANQTEDGITALMDALKARGYSVKDSEARFGAVGLNKSECLQIVNHAPESVVELHTLVEELSERFYDDQVEDMLGLVQTYIPSAPAFGEIEAANGEADPMSNGMEQFAQDGAFDHDGTGADEEGAYYGEDAVMDEDEFVNEGYGERGVEDAEPDD